MFLAFVRLVDPFYINIVKSIFAECFGIVIRNPKGMKVKPLNMYLAESLNSELINIIL